MILRQTNHIFPILGGAREIFGVFHVKNQDFTPKKNHIFSNFRGGVRRVRPPPPESAPASCHMFIYLYVEKRSHLELLFYI